MAEGGLLGNPALGKQPESPIDRGIADMGVLLAQAEVELFRRQVTAVPQKLIENDLPLPCRLETLCRQVATKSLTRFLFGLLHIAPS